MKRKQNNTWVSSQRQKLKQELVSSALPGNPFPKQTKQQKETTKVAAVVATDLKTIAAPFAAILAAPLAT